MPGHSSSSRFRDLIKFLSSVHGDLANITAPPMFLAPMSVVETGHCWAQHPDVFAAPAREEDPERRSLLVLRLILIALRSQLYIAGSPSVSIKKPLNAFLGETFIARWSDPAADASTRLVAEQVSHHPPITAMHIADEDNGVRADGYARVEMAFSGTVDIKQVGHAVLHVDRYDEDYLIPLPDVKVRGFMNGRLYPEILSTYHIVSSSGFVSEIKFSGAGIAWGKKNSFSARMYRRDDPKKTSIYEVNGVWSEGWTVTDARTGDEVEHYEVDAPENRPADMEIEPLETQDAWESHRAWAGVRDAIEQQDYSAVVREKSKIEEAQRAQRAAEKRCGKAWTPLLFQSTPGKKHEVFHELAEGLNWPLHDDRTKGVWRVDDTKIANLSRPLRGNTTPQD